MGTIREPWGKKSLPEPDGALLHGVTKVEASAQISLAESPLDHFLLRSQRNNEITIKDGRNLLLSKVTDTGEITENPGQRIVALQKNLSAHGMIPRITLCHSKHGVRHDSNLRHCLDVDIRLIWIGEVMPVQPYGREKRVSEQHYGHDGNYKNPTKLFFHFLEGASEEEKKRPEH